MSLSRCPECQGELTAEAPKCPHCGFPFVAARPSPASDDAPATADNDAVLRRWTVTIMVTLVLLCMRLAIGAAKPELWRAFWIYEFGGVTATVVILRLAAR